MTNLFTTIFSGFGLSAGLIIAIGAQNAFLLKQGLKREHVFVASLICALCDAVLIITGCLGVGTLVAKSTEAVKWITWIGAGFLFIYGSKSFYSALLSKKISDNPMKSNLVASSKVRKTVILTLGFSLLNPHVYLDTVLLIGGISSKYAFQERLYFILGACLASFIWFFSLGYGARFLSPIFKNHRNWKILDFLIGCTMWTIAYGLLN